MWGSQRAPTHRSCGSSVIPRLSISAVILFYCLRNNSQQKKDALNVWLHKKINRSEACRIRRLLCVTSWVRLCASENLIYTSDILKVEDQFQDDSSHCGLAELSHQVTRVVAAQLQTVKESSQTSTSLTFWCALRTSRLCLSLPKSLASIWIFHQMSSCGCRWQLG